MLKDSVREQNISPDTRVAFRQDQYLNEILSKRKRCYLEKNEVCELAPCPTPLTFDLLKQFYRKKGPVDKIYQLYGIKFIPRDFLIMIGNELYCDREKEIKTLFPERAWCRVQAADMLPKDLGSLATTIKNEFLFKTIKLDNYHEFIQEITIRLKRAPRQELTVKSVFEQIFDDYKIVFNVSLLANIAVNRLAEFVKQETISTSVLLANINTIGIEMPKIDVEISKLNLQGNSFQVSDEGKFMAVGQVKRQSDSAVETWWNALSVGKRRQLNPLLEQVGAYNRLLEYSRWLMVKDISQWRELLYRLAADIGFSDKRLIVFASLSEILSGHLYEKVCLERQQDYKRLSQFNWPRVITRGNNEQKIASYPLGLAPGLARGIVVTETDIDDPATQGQDKILYIKTLSPHLAKYIGQVAGIVAEFGTWLSPLAIIARDRGLPVVGQFDTLQEQIKPGDLISVDGTNGNVIKQN